MEILALLRRRPEPKTRPERYSRLESNQVETDATPESIQKYCAGLSLVRRDMSQRVYDFTRGDQNRRILSRLDKIILDLIVENYSVNQYLIARQKYEELLMELP